MLAGAADDELERGPSDKGFSRVRTCHTAGLKENLYDPLDLADYLLYRLNLRYFNPLFPTGPELLRGSPMRHTTVSRMS